MWICLDTLLIHSSLHIQHSLHCIWDDSLSLSEHSRHHNITEHFICLHTHVTLSFELRSNFLSLCHTCSLMSLRSQDGFTLLGSGISLAICSLHSTIYNHSPFVHSHKWCDKQHCLLMAGRSSTVMTLLSKPEAWLLYVRVWNLVAVATVVWAWSDGALSVSSQSGIGGYLLNIPKGRTIHSSGLVHWVFCRP